MLGATLTPPRYWVLVVAFSLWRQCIASHFLGAGALRAKDRQIEQLMRAVENRIRQAVEDEAAAKSSPLLTVPEHGGGGGGGGASSPVRNITPDRAVVSPYTRGRVRVA